jgi:hypothetical protein
MKTEPKPFASLSSGLLARKGAARPAMRPQGFGGQAGAGLEDLGWNDMGFEPPKPAEAERDTDHDAFGEELAPHPLRNPLAALTPVASPVHDQQSEIAGRLNVAEEDEAETESLDEDYDETAELVDVDEPVVAFVHEAEPEFQPEPAPAPLAVARPRRQPKARSAPGAKGKAAFTLRLDAARHLKLRLACAVNGRSAQQIVTDAVDRLLAEMPELDSMAERAPAKRAQA